MSRAVANRAFVMRLQARLGLEPDGWAGPKTQEALDAALGGVAAPPPPQDGRITDDRLIADLKRDEGYARALPDGRCQAYPDPLTNGPPWTIGYGHTGPDVSPGTIWTREKAERVLIEDAESHARDLEKRAPWVAGLDPVRRRVLHNMAYNLGVVRLLKFKNTLAFVQAGEWDRAANGMLASLWARQVKGRASRLADQMRTGTA